jgi:predicted RNase H-like nuclease (RuvC/YqgF family)
MARRGSGHGNPMHSVKGLVKGFNDLIEAANVLTGDPAAPESTDWQRQSLQAAVSRLKPELKVLNDLMAAVEASADFDLDLEPRRAAAEHELQEITDAVRQKASRAAELAEEIQRLTVAVDAKRVEAAGLATRIKEYRDTIAAI